MIVWVFEADDSFGCSSVAFLEEGIQESVVPRRQVQSQIASPSLMAVDMKTWRKPPQNRRAPACGLAGLPLVTAGGRLVALGVAQVAAAVRSAGIFAPSRWRFAYSFPRSPSSP